MERVQGLRQKIAGKSIPIEVRLFWLINCGVFLGYLVGASVLIVRVLGAGIQCSGRYFLCFRRIRSP